MSFCAAKWIGGSVHALCLIGCAATSRDVDFARADVSDSGPRGPRDVEPKDAGLLVSVLDRATFVRAVLARNRSIESAHQAWRAAAARTREAGAFDDPLVTADLAPLSIGSSSARFGWDVAISQRIPWPGKLALDRAAAESEADAAKSDFESVRRELALSAAMLFDDYFVAARAMAINGHHVELMQRMRAAASAQFESGHVSAEDPLRAEFELAHMEHDTVILASQRDVTVAQMNELLHRSPELALPPPPDALPAPTAPERLDTRSLEADAVDHRPDVAAARLHARAAQARSDRARREFFPDLSFAAAYSAMWDTPEHRWTVGLSFNLPVQTGRRAGAFDEAQAAIAEYEADVARLGDAARTQVVVAFKRLEEARHVLQLYEDRLVPIARDEVAAAGSAFTVSQAPFATVIDAEKNLRSVELEQEVAHADHDRRRAELDRALGRIPGLDERAVTP